MHIDSGSGPSSGVATSEILSPVVDKEQPNFNQTIASDNHLSTLDNKLKQINTKQADTVGVDKKESEQNPAKVKGESPKATVVEGNATGNITAALQVRVY